jgi:hypothetical protein
MPKASVLRGLLAKKTAGSLTALCRCASVGHHDPIEASARIRSLPIGTAPPCRIVSESL